MQDLYGSHTVCVSAPTARENEEPNSGPNVCMELSPPTQPYKILCGHDTARVEMRYQSDTWEIFSKAAELPWRRQNSSNNRTASTARLGWKRFPHFLERLGQTHKWEILH